MVIAAIIERVTKTPLHEYARRTLFQPLGIEQHEWVKDEDGKVFAASGLRLRSRDLAKLGLLYLRDGNWNGKQIVSEPWVRASTAPQVPEGTYGFQWWRASKDPAAPFIAAGNGGQRMLVNRERDLIVVLTAGMYRNPNQAEIADNILRECVAAVRATTTPR